MLLTLSFIYLRIVRQFSHLCEFWCAFWQHVTVIHIKFNLGAFINKKVRGICTETYSQTESFRPKYDNPHSNIWQYLPGQVNLEEWDKSTTISLKIMAGPPHFCTESSWPIEFYIARMSPIFNFKRYCSYEHRWR